MGTLLLLFVGIPILEVAVFVAVGDKIGIWNILLLIILTGVAGAVVAGQQGTAVWREARSRLQRGESPGRQLAHGAMILAGAMLLLTPGFVTDGVGFLLMLPPVRELLRRWGLRWLQKRSRIIDL